MFLGWFIKAPTNDDVHFKHELIPVNSMIVQFLNRKPVSLQLIPLTPARLQDIWQESSKHINIFQKSFCNSHHSYNEKTISIPMFVKLILVHSHQALLLLRSSKKMLPSSHNYHLILPNNITSVTCTLVYDHC
jgi:hypothetical protein